MFEQIVFELAAAHQKSLKNEEETFTAVCLVQVGLESPEECMAYDSGVLESFLKQKLSKWREMKELVL